MRVILKENIENLGRIGEIVEVSNGYARNFLLPKKWVIPADAQNVRILQHHQRILDKKRQKKEAEARTLADQLLRWECQLFKKVGAQDKLFGSVTAAEVAEKLKESGYSIDKKWIQFETPIKSLGTYSVQIQLERTVSVAVQIQVLAEGA